MRRDGYVVALDEVGQRCEAVRIPVGRVRRSASVHQPVGTAAGLIGLDAFRPRQDARYQRGNTATKSRDDDWR